MAYVFVGREKTVDYAGQVRKFIAESKEELGRLEEEIDRIREVVARLERFLQGREAGERRRLLEEPLSKEDPPPPSSRSYVPSPEGRLPQAPTPHAPSSGRLPPPSLPDPAPAEAFLRDDAGGSGEPRSAFRPVGEVAEKILQGHPGGMSLDELYLAMKDLTEIAPSRDLKNAIRVSLIRRRPQVVSPRRGWFRWEEKGVEGG